MIICKCVGKGSGGSMRCSTFENKMLNATVMASDPAIDAPYLKNLFKLSCMVLKLKEYNTKSRTVFVMNV